MKDYDVAVVGGGLLGSAFAFGLSATGLRVALFDEADNAIRAARGNFGLVWVQGKGRGMREYARWTLHSSQLWSNFARRLAEETGTDVGFHRPGGFHVAIDHDEHAQNLALLQQLRDEAGEEGYAFEVLEHAALKKALPGIGADVPGGTYCPHDGHANPLKLLRALHHGFQQNGGTYLPRKRVMDIAAVTSGGFTLAAANDVSEVHSCHRGRPRFDSAGAAVGSACAGVSCSRSDRGHREDQAQSGLSDELRAPDRRGKLSSRSV
jgi:glycine/D-amino acid oxidase-like deaminating enzyme